jgi:hypothetical protein
LTVARRSLRPRHEFEASSNGVVLVAVRPVAPARELLRVAAGEDAIIRLLRDDMTDAARRRDPYSNQGTSGLGETFEAGAAEADVWVATREHERSSRYQAYAEFHADGSFSYVIASSTPAAPVRAN